MSPKMRPYETVVSCPNCGTVMAVRELSLDHKPSWTPACCPRCGARLGEGAGHACEGGSGFDVRHLRRALWAHKLRQVDIAQRFGCTQSRMSCLITGRAMPTDEVLLELSDLLGVGPQELW